MKFFTELLFTQYYELKSKGRPTSSAKNTGILLISVLIILFFLVLFMAFNTFDVFEKLSSPLSGRATGRMFGLVGLGVAFAAVYLIFGNQRKYDAIIKSYEDFSDEEQNEVYKRGMKRFLILFCVLLILIIVFAVL